MYRNAEHNPTTYNPTTHHSTVLEKKPTKPLRTSLQPGRWLLGLCGLLVITFAPLRALDAQTPERSIAVIRELGKQGAGYQQAIEAAANLRALPVEEIEILLDAFADINPVAENWLRGIVFDVVRAARQAPLEQLQNYTMDQARNPLGRGLAMELIQRAAPETARELIGQCLQDPSLRLREMAVEQAIEQARGVSKARPEDAKQQYQTILVAARHPKQLERVVEALRDLGDDVSTATAFALITQWHGVAPFDNVDGVGFDKIYPPEALFVDSNRVDLQSSYEGKHDAVQWRAVAAADAEGVVNLADSYDKEKGAVAYLYAEFESSQSMPAQARLGCINANKVWINGEPLMSNEVYHSGSMIDQYVADFQIQAGTNRVLLKICQNEQTESWAQDWEFRFRITDPTGKGLELVK